MNDDQLTTAVQQSVSGLHMSVPAEDIISRAATIRTRRKIPAAAAALTAAAGTALAVTTLAAPGHPAPAQLTAWTVAKKPGGSVQVTIRDLRDLAGLQRRLRADGVPATVRFDSNPPTRSQLPRPCLNYPMPTRHLHDQGGHLAGGPYVRLVERIFQDGTTRSQTMFTIHPAAIPAVIGLWFNIRPPAHPDGDGASVVVRLVYASGRCPTAKTPTRSTIRIAGRVGSK